MVAPPVPVLVREKNTAKRKVYNVCSFSALYFVLLTSDVSMLNGVYVCP